MLVLAACLFLPFQLASADIKGDFKTLTMQQVLAKAVNVDKLSAGDAVEKMVTLHPEIVALIVAEALAKYPDKAGEIITAAVTAAPQFKKEIEDAAKLAKVDLAVILAAVAAASTTSTSNNQNNDSNNDKNKTKNKTSSTGGGGVSPG